MGTKCTLGIFRILWPWKLPIKVPLWCFRWLWASYTYTLRNHPFPFLPPVPIVSAVGGQQIVTDNNPLQSVKPLQKCRSLPLEGGPGTCEFPVSRDYRWVVLDVVIQTMQVGRLALQEESTVGSVSLSWSVTRQHPTHTHTHAHFPAHKNRQLYKMDDKNSHRKEAKLFKIKGLSQCRRESIWKVVEFIHEWMLELIICVLFMPLIVVSSKCLAASTHALNTVK